jgi:uracil-DNA glycosylase
LQNIYKELKADCAIPPARHGFLSAWAKQGVLLLNSVLTVEEHKPASHQGKGWELFTDSAIRALNTHKTGLIFVLWGAYAQKKAAVIDTSRHFVLSAAHPSPFSASRGFLGSRPFSQINAYLEKNRQEKIVWQLPWYALQESL